MIIENEFTVSVPADQAWGILTDIPAIAPCMPGAVLTGVDDGVFAGKVKVKVGPVTSEYQGTASFVERDESGLRAVISAKGREARGGGNASATITAQLVAAGSRTSVRVETDLKISGKIAQFGSSMIAEVSEKLLGQFVECLEATIASGSRDDSSRAEDDLDASGSSRSADRGSGDGPAVGGVDGPREPEAIDLMAVAGKSVAKRLVPALVAVFLVGLIIYRLVR